MNGYHQPRSPQSWEHLLEKDPHGATRFRLGVAAAVVIHLGIFAITWPTVAQPPPAEPDEVLIPFPITNLARPEQEPEPIPIEVPPPPPEGPPIISGPPDEPVEPVVRAPENAPVIPEGPVVHVPAPVDMAPPPDPVEDTIVFVGVDIDPPTIIHQVEPRYTEPARHAGIRGVVILELIIDTNGAVESIKVLRGLSLGLTRSAVDAVSQWRFEPSTADQQPVRVRYILTIHFNLR